MINKIKYLKFFLLFLSFVLLLTTLKGNSIKSKSINAYISSEQLFTSMKMAVMNNGEATPLYGTVQMAGDEGGDFIFIKR